ncbi:MAG: hypothetical protein LAT83_09460 [Kiritimatiellae bacterium]|nr:hypothetical protein [Kiritimatiellia bacterium]
MSKENKSKEKQSKAGKPKSSSHALDTATEIIGELNRELDARSAGLDPEIRTLLAQKGAVIQFILREFMRLLDETAERALAHDALVEKCKQWHDGFFVPLRNQSDGKPMAEAIYLSDLVKMIEELERVIAENAI